MPRRVGAIEWGGGLRRGPPGSGANKVGENRVVERAVWSRGPPPEASGAGTGGSALVRRSLWRRYGRIGRPGGTPGPGGAELGALPDRLKAKERESRYGCGGRAIIFYGLFPRFSSPALFGQFRNQF